MRNWSHSSSVRQSALGSDDLLQLDFIEHLARRLGVDAEGAFELLSRAVANYKPLRPPMSR